MITLTKTRPKAEFCVRKRIFDFQKGRFAVRILKILKPIRMLVTFFHHMYNNVQPVPSVPSNSAFGLVFVRVITGPRRDIVVAQSLKCTVQSAQFKPPTIGFFFSSLPFYSLFYYQNFLALKILAEFYMLPKIEKNTRFYDFFLANKILALILKFPRVQNTRKLIAFLLSHV